jgi:hypothetical protein
MAKARARPDDEVRVFISYSHKNTRDIRRLVKFLKNEVGVEPVYDLDLAKGKPFDDEIKTLIAHAHVFLPVLTSESDARKWVHQELGYAMALNLPVLPIAVGQLPGEMIQRLQAVTMDFGNVNALRRTLTRDLFDRLVAERSGPAHSWYRCASLPDERAAWLAEHSRNVVAMDAYGRLRQKGGLSSLHIPREVIGHPIWERRYRPVGRSDDHKRLQREERLALEQHAREAGCRLIVNPDLVYPDLCAMAVVARLESLRAFLKTMPDDKCEVAWNNSMDHDVSVTIVGNWFAAESVHARRGKGYYQTIFTRHAPCLTTKIVTFDDEFDGLLQLHGWKRRNSRREAIKLIERRLVAVRQLPPDQIMPRPA